MAMGPTNLFMLRRGLIDAGMKDNAAEQVAIALEESMANSLEQVFDKYQARLDNRFSKVVF